MLKPYEVWHCQHHIYHLDNITLIKSPWYPSSVYSSTIGPFPFLGSQCFSYLAWKRDNSGPDHRTPARQSNYLRDFGRIEWHSGFVRPIPMGDPENVCPCSWLRRNYVWLFVCWIDFDSMTSDYKSKQTDSWTVVLSRRRELIHLGNTLLQLPTVHRCIPWEPLVRLGRVS